MKRGQKCRGSGWKPEKLTRFSYGSFGPTSGVCPECKQRVSLKRDGTCAIHAKKALKPRLSR